MQENSSFLLIGQLGTLHIFDWLTKFKRIYEPSCQLFHASFALYHNILKYLAEETKIGDPIEAPPGPYKIQPDNQGKLLWITGSPGVGKSTSAQLLGRKKG